MPTKKTHCKLASLLIAALCLFTFANAQDETAETGTLAGVIVDTDGGALVDALVLLDGTAYGTTTDLQGRYRIPDIPAGRYDVTITKAGFRKSQVTGLRIRADKVTDLDFPLPAQQEDFISAPDATGTDPSVDPETGQDLQELAAFVVTAEEAADLGAALLADRQSAVNISDAIGAESFSRLGIGDAAEAMTKVTGASVVDGKYVVVRGLGDRYSNTLLNGNTVPSADPDRRAVQMDQFPSDLLESIVTSKSFTPDKPGDFSGGSVNIKTRSFPEQFFYSASLSLGFDSQATGEDIPMVDRDSGDNFAFSGRDAPETDGEVPDALTAFRNFLRGRGDAELREVIDYTNQFNNDNYIPQDQTAAPDFGLSFAIGDTIDLRDASRVGYTFSLTYDRSTDYYDDGVLGRYRYLADSDEMLNLRLFSPNRENFTEGFRLDVEEAEEEGYLSRFEQFGVQESKINVQWGLFGKLAYQPTTRHEISLDLLYNRSGEDQVRIGVGELAVATVEGMAQLYDLLYTERSIGSLQLSGKHLMGDSDELEVEWRGSLSKSTQDQPDYRPFGALHTLRGEDSFANTTDNPDADRFFRELTEDALEIGLDVTRTFVVWDGLDMKFKAGANLINNERTYDEEHVRFIAEVNSFDALETFPGQIGAFDGDEYVFGNLINQQNSLASYEGEQDLKAAYAMLEIPVTEPLKVIAGVRYSDTQIDLVPESSSTQQQQPGEIDQSELLPALHLIYEMNDTMNLRAAYGRTIARPTYKELGDIMVADPFTGDDFRGNAELEMTTIDNFDLRWEWFPRSGEIVAVSAFYKDMENPIEILQNTAGTVTPQNVEEGKVYGLEFEFRRNLDFINEALIDWSIGTNLALIESEVSVPESELENVPEGRDFSDTRELVDQSPYTFNFDLSYANPEWDSVFTLVFNVVGERLSLVRPGVEPDVFEQSSPSLDFIASKNFGDNWQVKFSASNLLAPDSEFVQELNGEEFIYSSHSTSRSFSLGVSYLFE